ncbi:MAG: hypothetical protein EP340_02955 [Alphaproteobacteria bacterium]|nr:MAG: hypothetical protein EP340_02955 [Alphaproteobacteria bacterium]
MTEIREKFATQIDAALLKEVRSLAKEEGRQIQALMDEALADLLEKRRQTRPRTHVMAAYERSLDRYAGLYEKLAQ